MHIRLLGTPEILGHDGRPCRVRGLQPWSVLARVLLSDRPVSRRQLAAELFPETVDPLGSLRWCLAALRRALGPKVLTGDPVRANLPQGCRIDALDIDGDDFDVLRAGELLQDSAPDACGSGFDTWLLVERARISARIDGRIRRDTLDALSREDATDALRLAGHLAGRQPYDEGAHILLIRALVLAGNPDAALRHAERTEAEFLRELGEPPTPALRSAARARLADPPPGPKPHAVIRALLQAGVAAFNVGAVDAGIDNLRRAATMAQAAADPALQAESLTELGSAMIHSVRGQDDEGIVHLRRAETLALACQNRPLACRAVLEQCYADALAARRPDAAHLSDRAFDLVADDMTCLATAHAFAGFNLADWGRHDEADTAYDRSLSIARAQGLARREGWALGLGAWGKLRSDRAGTAADWARACLDICDRLDWLSFRPWPEAVLAEAELADGGDPAAIRDRAQTTLAMACQLSDPCWEAAACRVIGLSHDKAGDPANALLWLDRAAKAFSGITDPYAALLLRIRFDRVRVLTATASPLAGKALHSLIIDAARNHAEAELRSAVALLADSGHPRRGYRPEAGALPTGMGVHRPN